MAADQTLFETITDAFVPIHRDGHKFIAIGLGVTLLMFLLWSPLGVICALITGGIMYFFRDPDRVTQMREGLISAPADGTVATIETVRPPDDIGIGDAERVRISIFLTVFDVHIQRAPIAGRVIRALYVPGAFLNAALDKASEDNERQYLVIENPSGTQVATVQIAGLIARRIVTFVAEGEGLGAGERYGLIRFGSRVDTYLPPGAKPLISVGQRTVAGETILADLRLDEPEREARRH